MLLLLAHFSLIANVTVWVVGQYGIVFPNGAPFTVDGKVLGKPYRYRLAKVLPRKKLYRSQTMNGRGLAYRSGISTVGFQRCPYKIDKAASLINHEPRR